MSSSLKVCKRFCACLCVFTVGVRVCVGKHVYICVCVCVCHNEKRVPDEWQARQATQAILQVSSSKHNAKKITTRVRGRFISRSLPSLQKKKEKKKQFTKPTHVAVYLCVFVCCLCVRRGGGGGGVSVCVHV